MSPVLHMRFRRDLRGFALEIELQTDRWPLVLLGRSGAGKTQLLRVLAGLERGAVGEIRMDGQTWLGPGVFLPPHRRSVGLCMQEGELFPNLTVAENVEYPLRWLRPRPEREERRRLAREMLARFGVADLSDARADRVSGGERGRIALARALVARPALLLADEPFAALDQGQRETLSSEMSHLLRDIGPAIWVTHDPREAERLGATVLELKRGRLLPEG